MSEFRSNLTCSHRHSHSCKYRLSLCYVFFWGFFQNNKSSTIMSHLWCVCVSDSISCIESTFLFPNMRVALDSILMYHKIHTCHSLHTDPFRWRNSTQVLRNHYVNIPNASESSHLGQIPTDIIVTDYARCKPCVIIQLIYRYQSVYCPVLKMLALIMLIAYQHVTLVHSWAPLGM